MFEKIQRLINAVFKQEYAKASVYYVMANIMGQGIVLISSAIFTRMMSKNDFGLVSTYSTWVLVLNTFICLNLFITVRNAYIDFADDYDNYNSSVLTLCILSGIVMTLVVIGATRIFKREFGLQEVLLACVQSVALNIVNYKLAIQSMKNEYRQRAVLMIAPNWAHVLLSVVLMLVFPLNMYLAKISGNAIGVLVFGIICTVGLYKQAVPRIVPKYWKYALKISVPSIANTLSDLILIQCDRLMLTAMVGAEETAEYSVVYNVGSIIVAIYQAINGAWTPWFYKRVAEREYKATKKYQGYYMMLFTVFTCGMLTISPELIKIISPNSYWGGIRYVGPIVVASYLIFLYAFLTSYLMCQKATGKIARNTIIAAVLNVVLNYTLIPQYKSVGAVMATVISYLVLFILHFLSIEKEDRRYFAIKGMCLSFVGIVVYAILFYFIKELWIARYVLFAAIFFAMYLFKGKNILNEFVGEKRCD